MAFKALIKFLPVNFYFVSTAHVEGFLIKEGIDVGFICGRQLREYRAVDRIFDVQCAGRSCSNRLSAIGIAGLSCTKRRRKRSIP
jgi:hypothetical protein